MPSVSYRLWVTVRAARLAAVERAHTTIHGTGPGRREATRLLNHAYAVLLAAEFQGYCRELHTEAVTHFAATLPLTQRGMIAGLFTANRQLDRGNASPATLGSDFARFGMKWWPAVDHLEPDGPALRAEVEQLNAWRNAVAHNDFDPARLGGTIRLKLGMVRRWRATCRRLARVFDRVLADRLLVVTGTPPW